MLVAIQGTLAMIVVEDPSASSVKGSGDISLIQMRFRTAGCSGGSTGLHCESSANSCSTLRWAANPSKCLDVSEGRTENGANVQLYDCVAGEPNQAFLLPVGGEGPVRWAKHPTKCLDVAAGRQEDGTNIQLWDCVENEENQLLPISSFGIVSRTRRTS